MPKIIWLVRPSAAVILCWMDLPLARMALHVGHADMRGKTIFTGLKRALANCARRRPMRKRAAVHDHPGVLKMLRDDRAMIARLDHDDPVFL